MDPSTINAKDYVDDTRPVVDCAALVGAEAARLLRSGARVLVSVRGVRGVSSSFFNVILSAVRDALGGAIHEDRFGVETETATQKMVYQRSLRAFSGAAP